MEHLHHVCEDLDSTLSTPKQTTQRMKRQVQVKTYIYIVFNHLAEVHKNEETRKNIDEEEEEEGRREQNL